MQQLQLTLLYIALHCTHTYYATQVVKVTGNKGKVKAPKKKDQIKAIELTDYSNLEQYEGMRVRVTNKAVTETLNSGR